MISKVYQKLLFGLLRERPARWPYRVIWFHRKNTAGLVMTMIMSLDYFLVMIPADDSYQ